MNILITGARGQLGNELRRLLETGYAEIGAIPAAYEGAQVDYVDFDVLDILCSIALRRRTSMDVKPMRPARTT